MTQETFSAGYPSIGRDTVWKVNSTEVLNEAQWRQVKRRYRMTERELEIARLICTGLSNEEIAEQIAISPATVKTHLRNIYRKTLVSTRITMLLRFLADAGQAG